MLLLERPFSKIQFMKIVFILFITCFYYPVLLEVFSRKPKILKNRNLYDRNLRSLFLTVKLWLSTFYLEPTQIYKKNCCHKADSDQSVIITFPNLFFGMGLWAHSMPHIDYMI